MVINNKTNFEYWSDHSYTMSIKFVVELCVYSPTAESYNMNPTWDQHLISPHQEQTQVFHLHKLLPVVTLKWLLACAHSLVELNSLNTAEASSGEIACLTKVRIYGYESKSWLYIGVP